MMRYTYNKLKGFTLIELLVVIAIIGILGAIVYAPFQTARRKGRDAQRIVEMKNIYSALLLYADSHNGQFPASMTALQNNQASDKLPSNTNFSVTPDLNKYNYTAYADNTGSGKIFGFHLYTHLETASPALSGAAKCWNAVNTADPTACFSGVVAGVVPTSTNEPQDGGTGAYFIDHSGDRDDVCATDLKRCIYDIKG